MRIRIVRKPTQPDIDGVNLSLFEVGCEYDVGRLIATFLIAEQWAEPIDESRPTERSDDTVLPPNLQREIFPPYYDAPPALATERRRRPRRRR